VGKTSTEQVEVRGWDHDGREVSEVTPNDFLLLTFRVRFRSSRKSAKHLRSRKVHRGIPQNHIFRRCFGGEIVYIQVGCLVKETDKEAWKIHNGCLHVIFGRKR